MGQQWPVKRPILNNFLTAETYQNKTQSLADSNQSSYQVRGPEVKDHHSLNFTKRPVFEKTKTQTRPLRPSHLINSSHSSILEVKPRDESTPKKPQKKIEKQVDQEYIGKMISVLQGELVSNLNKDNETLKQNLSDFTSGFFFLYQAHKKLQQQSELMKAKMELREEETFS